MSANFISIEQIKVCKVMTNDFYRKCKSSRRTKYFQQWSSGMMQFDRFPLLRTNRRTELAFKTEQYLYLAKKRHFPHAMSQLKASFQYITDWKGAVF